MTEAEAKAWIVDRWGKVAVEKLAHLAALVLAEAALQNLIAPSTMTQIWNRHIVDSAQLLTLADNARKSGLWLDIGTGAGFPGLVIACLSDRPIVLVEPRPRRAAFLERAAGALGLAAKVMVYASKVGSVDVRANVISARAVAPLATLFGDAQHNADEDTLWILPKGQSAREELASARQTWQGVFHVEHSVTDPDALIVVASKVVRR